MLKKALILILVAAMLLLSSCKVVDVIDHGTTLAPEQTTPPTEYDPWGFWYSYDTAGAIEFEKDTGVARLYSLTTGYYEYYKIQEATYTYHHPTISVQINDQTFTFTFDKFANALTLGQTVYQHVDKAPTEHPQYDYPYFGSMDPSIYVTVEKLDFEALRETVLAGATHDIAMEFYGSYKSIPEMEGTERPAQYGDLVNIDFIGKLDDVAFQGGTSTNEPAFISDYQNGYIPGFTDGIIGHFVGDTFDVEVTFPENYHAPDLAGKAVVFTMTLNAIYDLSLTDEQVANYEKNEYKTYTEWHEAQQKSVAETVVSDTIMENASPIEMMPKETYLYFYQQTIDYCHALAYYYGMSYEMLLSYYGMSEQGILSQSVSQATYNIAIQAILKNETLSWTEEDFNEKYESYVSNYLESNEESTREDAVAYADKFLLQMRDELAEETVMEWAFGEIFKPTNEQQ